MMIFILYILRERFIRICSVVCLGIFSIKILSNAKANNMLAFAFSLRLVFGVFVGHCILSYFLWKKKKKIIAEIDLVIKNYESADFNKLLHSEKKTK